jgi:hypothetical protein
MHFQFIYIYFLNSIFYSIDSIATEIQTMILFFVCFETGLELMILLPLPYIFLYFKSYS